MNSLAEYVPPAGLSIPVVTIIDSAGHVLVRQQREAVRFLLQKGSGADIVFACGTTGEWNRLDNPRRQTVSEIAIDECRRFNAAFHKRVEAWVGITAETRKATLENLDFALEAAADAAVIAPLSIADADDPVEFVGRDIGARFEQRGRQIPVFLYDNADIAVSGKAPHLHTRDVKLMSRLEYVRGVKVSASRTVVANYRRAASHFKRRHEFAICIGNAYLIFDLFAPAVGLGGRLRRWHNRYLTRNALPYGIVSGPANIAPREWKRAWQVCRAGEPALMERYRRVLEEFRDICRFERAGRAYVPAIACFKAALAELGVCDSTTVAPGTPSLDSAQRREFGRRFREAHRRAAAIVEPDWLSVATRAAFEERALVHG